ncbi:MAG: gliding motility protein GldL [Bacteroidota bacterium]
MKFWKSSGFKYLKNLIIGVGAAAVMLGALGKINSYPWGGTAITIGLLVEAGLFLMLGLIPPEKDYYWEKLYPGLDKYNSSLNPLTLDGGVGATKALNGEVVESRLGGMLDELQSMSKSLGSLKALQEVDFSETSDQIKSMGNFYSRMNEAMSQLSETVEDTKEYRNQISSLNKNLGSLNNVYGNVLGALTGSNPNS